MALDHLTSDGRGRCVRHGPKELAAPGRRHAPEAITVLRAEVTVGGGFGVPSRSYRPQKEEEEESAFTAIAVN